MDHRCNAQRTLDACSIGLIRSLSLRLGTGDGGLEKLSLRPWKTRLASPNPIGQSDVRITAAIDERVRDFGVEIEAS